MAFTFVSSQASNSFDNPSAYTSTTGTLASPISVPANSLIVLAAVSTPTYIPSASDVTDASGLVWHLANYKQTYNGTTTNAVYYAVSSAAITSYSPVVTLPTGETYRGLSVSVFDGVDLTNPLGGTATTAYGNNDPTVTLSTVVAGSLIVSHVVWEATAFQAPGYGDTSAVYNPPVSSTTLNQDGTNHRPSSTLYKLSSATSETSGGLLHTAQYQSSTITSPWACVGTWFNVAPATATLTETSSGTASITGSAAHQYSLTETSTGTASYSGTATPSYSYSYPEPAAWTVIATGLAEHSYRLLHKSAANVPVTGDSSTSYSYNESSNWTVTATGSAEPLQAGQFTRTASGTITVTGHSYPLTNLIYVGSGVVSTTGQTHPLTGKQIDISSSGLIAVSGTTVLSYQLHELVNGSANVSGTTSLLYSYIESASGYGYASGTTLPYLVAAGTRDYRLRVVNSHPDITLVVLSQADVTLTANIKPDKSLRIVSKC